MKRVLLSVLIIFCYGVVVANAPQKIRMDSGERLMGFYTTDDLPTFSSTGYVKLNSDGATPVGALFDDVVLGDFVGGEIVRFRFAVACDVEVVRAFIYPVTTDVYIESEPLVDIDISSTLSAGWHDVELPEPLTIESDLWYLLGFEYVETSTNAPIVTDGDLNADYTSEWGILAYGNFGSGDGWYTFGNTYGDVCVQAVVRGGNFADEDIALAHLSVDNRIRLHEDLNYSFDVKNLGNSTPTTYTLLMTIDGEEADLLDTPVPLSGMYQTLSGTLDMSQVDEGRHILSIIVVDIDGHTPTERLTDDVVEASFVVYDQGVERQRHLIEAFTATTIAGGVNGDEMIETIQEKYPDKYVPVMFHVNRFGDDPYYLTDGSSDHLRVFTGCTTYPSAVFSRSILSTSHVGSAQGAMTVSIGYGSSFQDEEAGYIDEAVEKAFADYPAFVSVDISTDWDEATRQLTILVSGEGIDAAKQVLDGNRLTIYLTEDGLVGPQSTSNEYLDDYVHNNVLRLIANEYAWGDEVNWTTDSSYENTVVATLEDEWNVDNMHVVAFISGPMAVWRNGEWYYADQEDAVVNNANVAKIIEVPEGISVVGSGETSGGAVQYYTTDGRRVTAPIRGVTIVRRADGTTKKMIKK